MNDQWKALLEYAEQAVTDLNSLLMDVESSGNWTVYDIYGGGLANRIFKNKKIRQAERKVDLAKRSVQILGSEVLSSGMLPDGISREDWVFADSFLDLPPEEWIRADNLMACDIQARAAVNKAKALRDAILQSGK